MKKLCTLIMLCISVAAFAQTSKKADCLLEVHGKKYIQHTCQFKPDSDGSFQISQGGYFALVLIEEKNIAKGYWNKEIESTHADSDLGILKRRGACWQNETAKICAWAK